LIPDQSAMPVDSIPLSHSYKLVILQICDLLIAEMLLGVVFISNVIMMMQNIIFTFHLSLWRIKHDIILKNNDDIGLEWPGTIIRVYVPDSQSKMHLRDEMPFDNHRIDHPHDASDLHFSRD
jgi:hypothetical protein